MILSMTGFSTLTCILPNSVTITMTLKSLNSRFFEVNCKLPHALTQLETQLIKLFKAHLFRGNIYFTLHITNPNALVSSVTPSVNIISSYLHAIKHIQEHFPIEGSLSVSDLLNLPHLFSSQEEQLSQDTIDYIITQVQSLVENLEQTRMQEGSMLALDIEKRIAAIRSYLQELEPRAAFIMEQKKQQLISTLQSIAPEGEQLPADIHSLSLYNQLDKLDVHEEIMRFNTHLDNLSSILQAAGHEKGKKIDFTLQELFREINTITSKGSDAQLSSIAINIKVELEKAREQAQNIV